MSALYTNNASTTLASGINSSVTSLTVASGGGSLFPSISGTDFFYATLENSSGTVREIVKVTARSTDTFTIVRAQDNTSANTFSTGDKVELRATAAEMTALTAGSARGGNSDQVFFENGQTVTANYTITAGKSAVSTGPVTINSGVSVTIPSGSRWVIL